MNKFKLLFILLFVPAISIAEVEWTVYIATSTANLSSPFGVSSEIKLSSGTINVTLPTNEQNISCYVLEPYYFSVPGIPYPLVEHRYFVCDLGVGYTVAIESGCGLKSDNVMYSNLIFFTPSYGYKIDFVCANFLPLEK